MLFLFPFPPAPLPVRFAARLAVPGAPAAPAAPPDPEPAVPLPPVWCIFLLLSPLPNTSRCCFQLGLPGRDGQHSPSVVPGERGPRKAGSQPSPVPAVGFRGQLQLHTAQIHTEKGNEAPKISHSHACTSSPPRTAPAEHPAAPPASVSPLRPFRLPCLQDHRGWGHPGVPPGPRGQDCHCCAFRDPHFSAPNPTPEPQQHQK